MSTDFDSLEIEGDRADGAVIVRVCREHARNALDRATIEELDLAMALCGCRELAEITSDLIRVGT